MTGVRFRDRLGAAARISPESTRRATMIERYPVTRLRWDQLVRFNRYLELVGKFTTVLWVAFILTVVIGVDWKHTVQSAFNSGEPVKEAFALVLIVPSLLFVAARSGIGFVRWRMQRELWRREAGEEGWR